MSHLASHGIGHLLIHGFQGYHQPFILHRFLLREDTINLLLDIIEAGIEFSVLAPGEGINIFYHTKNIDRYRRTTRSNKRHTKGLSASKGPLHIGHNLEGSVIGIQQELKAVIALPKGNAESFDIRSRKFRLLSKKLLYTIKQCAHYSKVSLYADIGFSIY